MRSPYPLQWPEGVKRAFGRKASPFQVSLDQARRELCGDLHRMRASDVVITSDRDASGDKGVAVYYWRNNVEHCIACDQYASKTANLRAVGHVVAALRSIERHGGAYLLDQAAKAFELPQLPAPRRPWYQVLDVAQTAPLEVAEAAYRALAQKWHPDKPGGDSGRFQELADAIDDARTALGGQS